MSGFAQGVFYFRPLVLHQAIRKLNSQTCKAFRVDDLSETVKSFPNATSEPNRFYRAFAVYCPILYAVARIDHRASYAAPDCIDIGSGLSSGRASPSFEYSPSFETFVDDLKEVTLPTDAVHCG